MNVYTEIGDKKVFAVAVDWPGFARIGKSEQDALEALGSYAKRYKKAIAASKLAFPLPRKFEVVERVSGGHRTDFGAPGAIPELDAGKLSEKELARQIALLRVCWKAFDAMADKHVKAKLSTGPRGGGRSVSKMVDHVIEADRSYLSAIGGKYDKNVPLRDAIVTRLQAWNDGEPIENKREKEPWPPRYLVRRSAWHALDHAWEIEDRAS